MNSLHLHIDRIVVDGLPEPEQRRFAQVLESHLDQFARNGVATRFATSLRKTIPSLNAGRLRRGATAEQAAALVVHALRQSIGAGQSSKQAPAATSAGEASRHV